MWAKDSRSWIRGNFGTLVRCPRVSRPGTPEKGLISNSFVVALNSWDLGRCLGPRIQGDHELGTSALSGELEAESFEQRRIITNPAVTRNTRIPNL